MGRNLDLCMLLGLPEKLRCPRCNIEVETPFDDYDIECGNPNPSPGVWSLGCSCSKCEREWRFEYQAAKAELEGRPAPRCPGCGSEFLSLVFHQLRTKRLKCDECGSEDQNEYCKGSLPL